MPINNQNILVTGVHGFVGEHVINELVQAGHKVTGTDRRSELSASLGEKVSQYISCDLSNPDDVRKINWNNIDSIIHLAGLSNVGASFEHPSEYMSVNTSVIIEMFEACIKANAYPRFIAISSGAVYKPTNDCIDESFETQATSPYAASKLASEILVSYYRGRGFDDATIARPFNHIGPGQGPGFIASDLSKQISYAGDGDEIQVGNLLTARDYTDVRDVARAYRMLAEADDLKGKIYNICSSKSVKGTDLFEEIVRVSGKSNISYKSDVNRLRPTDTPYVCGSNKKIQEDTGWQPEISLETTLADVLKSFE